LSNSDIALLGNDLGGVPAAVGVAASTYAVIIQNFGWAMGYNIAALPLAAFGLLDPLIAAVAMGLSSLIVVLNSLRLTRLGRGEPSTIGHRRRLRGRRGVAVSVVLPVLLFAGLTVVSEALSPARGQALLPTLPSITTVNLPHSASVETYFDPGGVGVNQFHLIFEGTTSQLATVAPLVTASVNGGPATVLRQLKVSAGHYSDIVVLSPGRWRFDVRADLGGGPVSFTVARTVP
jgi:hypothetical protein